MSDVILACVSAWTPPHNTEASERLRSLGGQLTDLAALKVDEFREALRTLAWRLLSRRISEWEFILRQFGASPSYWAADVERHIRAGYRLAADPDFPLPCDIRYRTDDRHETVRSLVGQFGQLLCWWPAIVDNAQALTEEGRPLACRVR